MGKTALAGDLCQAFRVEVGGGRARLFVCQRSERGEFQVRGLMRVLFGEEGARQ